MSIQEVPYGKHKLQLLCLVTLGQDKYLRHHFQIINRESCDYADCDYADYADGPIKYKQMSKIQAEEIKKNIIEEEKEL